MIQNIVIVEIIKIVIIDIKRIINIKEVKKRKDSIGEYEKGGRDDLVKQINEEIGYLEIYLPKQLSRDEVKNIVEQVIIDTGAKTMKDMGIVMKTAKEKIGASSDGKTINEIVKELLA